MFSLETTSTNAYCTTLTLIPNNKIIYLMPEAQQAEPQPTPQPQVTTGTKPHDWKKVGLTVLIIIVVTGLIIVAYWFLVLNKTSEVSDLTGPVPKVTTKTATESAKESTPSAEKDETADWKSYNSTQLGFSIKHPNEFPFVKEQLSILGGQIPSVLFSNNSDFSSTDTKITTFSVSKGNFKATYDSISSLELNKAYSRAVAEAPDIVEETRLADVSINNQTGIKRSYLPTNKGVGIINYILDVHIKKGSDYYKISMTSGTKENYEKNIKIFDLIVSTFKFLN